MWLVGLAQRNPTFLKNVVQENAGEVESTLKIAEQKHTMYENVFMEVLMLKATSVTVHVKPAIKTRLEALAQATKRSKSYVIEEALEFYLDANEWQIDGIAQALAEADSPDAVFVDHDEVLAKWEAKIAD